MRPLETQPVGEIVPCDGPDGPADQALILGPPTGEEAGDGADPLADPLAEASDGTTAPALAADLIDGTNLFGDRAASWTGDPSEVGAGYGTDPSHAEICLCDETALAGGEGPDLAS